MNIIFGLEWSMHYYIGYNCKIINKCYYPEFVLSYNPYTLYVYKEKDLQKRPVHMIGRTCTNDSIPVMTIRRNKKLAADILRRFNLPY